MASVDIASHKRTLVEPRLERGIDAWPVIARHGSLAVVLDLDATLMPQMPRVPLDRGLVLLLDALHHAGVQVVIVSGRSDPIADQVRAQAPHAWWFAKRLDGRERPAGEVVAWIHDRLRDVRLIAIGDAELGEELFEALDHADVGVVVQDREARPTRASVALSGVSAVRAMLWWLVEARIAPGATAGVPPVEPVTEQGSHPALLSISGCRRRERGAPATVLWSALQEVGGLWLAWSGADGPVPTTPAIGAGQPRQATFDLTRLLCDRFHAGFCDGALWPLVHGFVDRVRYTDEDWLAYVTANEIYARLAVRLTTPTSTIWVHDYPLLLVADACRAYGHRGPIGLFLHVPFPPHAELETLPWARQLIEGMQAFDLIGFQTAQWADNFRSCLEAFGAKRRPQLGVFPVGIDPIAPAPVPDPELAGLSASLGNRRLILGVDRLDHSAGILERLAAYTHLLERYPEWRRNVTLVQLAAPASTASSVELRERVELAIGRINGLFGEADWVPVRYLHRAFDRRVLTQLHRHADVGLVTPLRDGLNLTAKEFVAAQDLTRPGVLVLSRFSGAAVELADAVLTNPRHPAGLASDIDRALRMPLEERRQRATRLARVVARTTPHHWATSFLERLDATRPA
jgi:trehalose-6-phosphate synthase